MGSTTTAPITATATEAAHKLGTRTRQPMASIARRFQVRVLALVGAGLSLVCVQHGPAIANAPSTDGWIAIPTRLDEIKVRYKPMGCKAGICTIQVQGLTKDEAISNEQIDCKANTIRNATSPVSTGWKVIAPGTVDRIMANKVCQQP